MKDIETRADIELLVHEFYTKALINPLLEPIFTKAKLDLKHHIPHISNFWESVLLENYVFEGNPMSAHIMLSKKIEMNKLHFDQWLQLFHATINKYFKGEIANKAIERSTTMGQLMLFKIEQHAKAK